MKIVKSIFLPLFLLSAPLLYASNIQEALSAYQEYDYEKAAAIFRELASDGDSDSAFYLGVMYNEGTNGIDNFKARHWLKKASLGGSILAPAEYAVLLNLGHGGDIDRDSGTVWMQRSLELLPKIEEKAWNGNGFAQVIASVLYGATSNPNKDEKKARFWSRQAAEQLHPQGVHHYAIDLLLGEDQYRDYKNGSRLLLENADRGFPWSQRSAALLSFYEFEGLEVEKEAAFGYAVDAYKHGLADAGVLLARMHLEGFTGEKNVGEAKKILHKVYENGDTAGEAAYRLAKIYLDKEGGPDLESAASWMERSYDHGYEKSTLWLAYMYQGGKGVPLDKERAFDLFLQSAENEDAKAQKVVADLYRNGDGVEANLIKAQQWYQRARDNGNEEASSELMASRWSLSAYHDSEDLNEEGFDFISLVKNIYFLPGDGLAYLLSKNDYLTGKFGIEYSSYGSLGLGIFSAFIWLFIFFSLIDS